MKELRIIGIMSGTSLDGLDLAACTFSYDSKWRHDINYSKTVSYPEGMFSALQCLDSSTAIQYAQMDHNLGRFFGEEVKKFMAETGFAPDYISSHGHTIFHQPDQFLTTQIGHPAAIAALTQIPVIADFRTVDVHLGGQGAPLVPIGDLLLFSEFKYCLNLGGIANISIKTNDSSIIAFDTGIANMALNYITRKVGKEYDFNGEMARQGTVQNELLSLLNNLEYYSLPAPKSIGKEWFDSEVKPLLEQAYLKHGASDVLCTLCEHMAVQIGHHTQESGKLLVTGGGAKNGFLVKKLIEKCSAELILPRTELIDYKEALIFAFLGALHADKQINILQNVTGSSADHIGGCIFNPFLGGKI